MSDRVSRPCRIPLSAPGLSLIAFSPPREVEEDSEEGEDEEAASAEVAEAGGQVRVAGEEGAGVEATTAPESRAVARPRRLIGQRKKRFWTWQSTSTSESGSSLPEAERVSSSRDPVIGGG